MFSPKYPLLKMLFALVITALLMGASSGEGVYRYAAAGRSSYAEFIDKQEGALPYHYPDMRSDWFRSTLLAAGDENWDAAFGVPGMDTSVYALVVHPDGGLYAGGVFTTAGGAAVNYIAYWDGSTWSDLNGGMDNSVWALAVDEAGDIYAAGDFTTAGGVSANRIARWDGTNWHPLVSGTNGPISTLAFDQNNQLYAGGSFNVAGGTAAERVARWDGSQWYALGSGMNSPVRSLAVGSNGDLYAGGVFTTAGGVNADRIARWDGSQWYSLGSGLNNIAWAMQIGDSGDLYVGGGFTIAGGQPANHIARWDGANWYAVGGGVDNVVRALAFDGDGRLSVGGEFVTAGGSPFNYIARWDGTDWLALGSGMTAPVRALTPNNFGDLFAGGDFTTAGDKTANYIAWWHRSFYPPAANDDSYTTQEDVPLVEASPGVLSNDTDMDDNLLTASVQSGPGEGSLSLELDGSFVYTPTLDFYGSTTFTYIASDGIYTDTATVTITVTPVNDAPSVEGDVYTTTEDTELNVFTPGVLANDSDPDGDSLAASVNALPNFGTLAFNADGSFSYMPVENYYGLDVFLYDVTDGVFTSTAAVTITVLAVNDPPVALGDSASTDQDNPVTTGDVLANDSDVEGDNLYVDSYDDSGTLGLVADNGDGTFDYDPNGAYDWLDEGEQAEDTFSYTAADGQGGFDTAAVTVTVSGYNDMPAAQDDSYTLDEDAALVLPAPGVLDNDSDVDGDPLSAFVLTDPSHGVLVLDTDGSFTFTPEENYFGPDSFTYEVSDGVLTDTAMVSLTINPVNDSPVAANDSYETDEDTQLVVPAPGVLDNDSDADGDLLSAVLVSGTAHGTLTLNADGSFTYMPEANFSGTDGFTYRASDGSLESSTASVSITVNPLNDAPLVEAGEDQNVVEGQLVNFFGSFTDPGFLQMGITAETLYWEFGDGETAAGTLTPTHTYTDDGVYTVTLTVTDDLGGAGSDSLLVTVSNVAPSLGAQNDRTIIAGDVLEVIISFDDPGLADQHSLSFLWGDGGEDTFDLDLGLREFQATHVYNEPGSYMVAVTVMDDDGGQGALSFSVTAAASAYSFHLPVIFHHH